MLKCNTQHIEHIKQNKTEWGVQKKEIKRKKETETAR